MPRASVVPLLLCMALHESILHKVPACLADILGHNGCTGVATAVLLLLLQEHTNTIRRFQFVSLQEAAAYVAKVQGKVLCAMSGIRCTTCFL